MPAHFDKNIKKLAPAKINLFLHVLGRRDDGYHDLQSLFSFADFGDEISIAPSDALRLHIDGEFAAALNAHESDVTRTSGNILIKALWVMADLVQKTPQFDITLTKNTPLGAGLGGGSADAAALIGLLCDLWQINTQTNQFKAALFKLGADVPACFFNAPCVVMGAGEKITKAPQLFDLHAVLIHPQKHCSTKDIFSHPIDYSEAINIPASFQTRDELIAFLKQTRNDLKRPAMALIPEINDVLNALHDEDGLLFSNMSGSGSACFGLFDTIESAKSASKAIKNLHPSWWVQAVTLQS